MGKRIEEVREYFVNPECPESVDDLAGLGAETIGEMARIYASGGRYIPEINGGGELAQVVDEMLKAEAATRIFDNKFMGQIHPQGNKIGILANMVAAYMNTNTVVREVSMAENRMEAEVLARMARWFGLPNGEFSGNMTVGGTTANLAAMWVAREKVRQEMQNEGLSGRDRREANLYIIGTEMAHYSIAKATDMLGGNVIFLKAETEGYKTDPESVEKLVRAVVEGPGRDRRREHRVMAIVGLAGETETGEIDDLTALADIAEKYGVFLHVDAAYGGPFVLSKEGHRFAGIDRADSITIDPHKLLYVPYAAGAVLFRDYRSHMLVEAGMRNHARYLLKEDVRNGDSRRGERNFGMSRVEGSMGSGGVIATWATLRLLGEEGITALLDHTIDLTRFAYERVLESEVFRPMHVPETNTLLIGLRGDLGLSKVVRDEVIQLAQARADAMGYYVSVNGELDEGSPVLRMVPMHPYTTKEDVAEVIAVLEAEIKNYIGR